MVDHTKERMKIERFYCSPKNSVTLDKPILLIFKKAPFSLLWLILCYSACRAISRFIFTFRLNNFLPVTLCVRSKKLIIKIRLFTYFLYLPLNSRSKFWWNSLIFHVYSPSVTSCVRSKKLIIKRGLFTYFLYLPLNSRSKIWWNSLIFHVYSPSVTSCVRSLKFCTSKLTVLDLMLDLSNYVPDDIILELLLPYMFYFVKGWSESFK